MAGVFDSDRDEGVMKMRVKWEHVGKTLGFVVLGAVALWLFHAISIDNMESYRVLYNKEPKPYVVYDVVSFPNGWENANGLCRDGWQSPSIGAQGACSGHGGVDTRLRATAADGSKWTQSNMKFICKANNAHDCLSLGYGQWMPPSVKYRVGTGWKGSENAR